jgi:hypothetical protein
MRLAGLKREDFIPSTPHDGSYNHSGTSWFIPLSVEYTVVFLTLALAEIGYQG